MKPDGGKPGHARTDQITLRFYARKRHLTSFSLGTVIRMGGRIYHYPCVMQRQSPDSPDGDLTAAVIAGAIAYLTCQNFSKLLCGRDLNPYSIR